MIASLFEALTARWGRTSSGSEEKEKVSMETMNLEIPIWLMTTKELAAYLNEMEKNERP